MKNDRRERERERGGGGGGRVNKDFLSTSLSAEKEDGERLFRQNRLMTSERSGNCFACEETKCIFGLYVL